MPKMVSVCSLFCSLFFVSCSKEISVTKIITFNTNGGSAIDPITVDKNTTSITTPTTTRNGYVFADWYTEEALTIPMSKTTTNLDFSASPINTSLTLYAKWQVTYTINYDINTGTGNAPTAQTYIKYRPYVA